MSLMKDLNKPVLFGDLGKATRRGVRKCPKCFTINGTRGLSCKNSLCDVVFKKNYEIPADQSKTSSKKSVHLEACKLITDQANSNSWTTTFSIRLRRSLIRGVLIQSCSAGVKNFTKCVFYHVQFSGVIQNIAYHRAIKTKF